jgi:hypothetical protein
MKEFFNTFIAQVALAMLVSVGYSVANKGSLVDMSIVCGMFAFIQFFVYKAVYHSKSYNGLFGYVVGAVVGYLIGSLL